MDEVSTRPVAPGMFLPFKKVVSAVWYHEACNSWTVKNYFGSGGDRRQLKVIVDYLNRTAWMDGYVASLLDNGVQFCRSRSAWIRIDWSAGCSHLRFWGVTQTLDPNHWNLCRSTNCWCAKSKLASKKPSPLSQPSSDDVILVTFLGQASPRLFVAQYVCRATHGSGSDPRCTMCN